MESLSAHLSRQDWSAFENANSEDTKLELFRGHVLEAIFELAPLVTVNLSRPPAPWINETIRMVMQRWDQAYRQYQRCKRQGTFNAHLLANYRLLRNEVKTRIESAKKDHVFKQVSSCRDSRHAWDELRRLGFVKDKRSNLSITLSPVELNQAFTAVFSTPLYLAASIIAEIPNSLRNLGYARFELSPVTQRSVSDALMINTSNSLGPDQLPGSYLRLVSSLLLPRITDIINLSFTDSMFPTEWRRALITPINKVPAPTGPQDFRPISILSALSKTVERIVHGQLVGWLSQHNLLDPLQAGFRKGHSTANLQMMYGTV